MVAEGGAATSVPCERKEVRFLAVSVILSGASLLVPCGSFGVQRFGRGSLAMQVLCRERVGCSAGAAWGMAKRQLPLQVL